MNSIYKFFFIGVVIIFCSTIVYSDTNIIDIENDMYNIKINGKEDISNIITKFTFIIRDKTDKKEYFVEMQNSTTDVKKFHIYKDKLVVLGRVGNNIADTITIIDLKLKKEIDFIICYNPQLSDTARYLVFIKFYPRFSPDEAQSSLVLIYDLEKLPSNNRIDERSKSLKREEIEIGSPEYTILSENVGNPIYPIENIEGQTYFMWIENQEERHLVTSGFLWLDQDSIILFIDRYKKKKWIVLVDISRGLGDIKIIVKPYEDT